MVNIQSIDPGAVVRAYKGKPGCMCGCKGKYYTSSKVDHSIVNPAMVTKILRTIQANEDLVEIDEGGAWISARVDGKDNVVYLVD